jgi:hypothetical protein
MTPDLLSTAVGLTLVCVSVFDASYLQGHAPILALAGLILGGLGAWAYQADYLKWPGVIIIIAGAALVVVSVFGLAVASSETVFWVVFWSGNSAGVVALWSALYRGTPGVRGGEAG